MSLLDKEKAMKMRLNRRVEIATSLANPKVSAALKALLDEGLEPSIVHGCLTYMLREKSK